MTANMKTKIEIISDVLREMEAFMEDMKAKPDFYTSDYYKKYHDGFCFAMGTIRGQQIEAERELAKKVPVKAYKEIEKVLLLNEISNLRSEASKGSLFDTVVGSKMDYVKCNMRTDKGLDKWNDAMTDWLVKQDVETLREIKKRLI